MSYYPSDAVFLTQGEPLSLTNTLYRTRVARLLADADNQVATVIQRQPLKVVTAIQQRVIDGYTTTYSLSANQVAILARLRLAYANALEMGYLVTVLAALPNYEAAVTALAPAMWLRLRETSGTTVANSGTTAAGTFTPGTGAVGQTGQLGANEAFRFDGADSKISVPASVLINNLTDFTWAVLCNFATAGENGAGNLLVDAGGNRILALISATPFRLNWQVWHTSDFSTRISAAGVQNITANTWAWVFATYTAADKTPRLYVGRSGAVNELTYSTSTISVNALANSSGAMLTGNNNANTRTVDGLIDEAIIFPSVLTTAQMLSIVQASGLVA